MILGGLKLMRDVGLGLGKEVINEDVHICGAVVEMGPIAYRWATE